MRSAPADGQPKEVFTCADCGQTYSRLEYLRRHQRKHDDVRPFGCDICPKTFARSDVLLRHKRRCHLDQGEGDVSNSADKDAATTLALAAAAAAAAASGAPGSGPGRRRRRTTTNISRGGRGGRRSTQDRSRSPQRSRSSRSPRDDGVHPNKMRRLDWEADEDEDEDEDDADGDEDAEGEVDDYARTIRATASASRSYGYGQAAGYNIDPRLTEVVDQEVLIAQQQQAAMDQHRGSRFSSSTTPDSHPARYGGQVDSKYSGGYAQFHAHQSHAGGYSASGSERYERSSAGGAAGSSAVASPHYDYRSVDELGRQSAFGPTGSGGGGGGAGDRRYTDFYYPFEGMDSSYDEEASSHLGRHVGQSFDYRRSASNERGSDVQEQEQQQERRRQSAAVIPPVNPATGNHHGKRNSTVNMEDATTLLAMAYGGFGQWDGQPQISSSSSAAAAGTAAVPRPSSSTRVAQDSARRTSQAQAPASTPVDLAAQAHRQSLANAGEVAGLTVVPDWQPGQSSNGFGLPPRSSTTGSTSSGWTGGRPDGMGNDGRPFEAQDASHAMSMAIEGLVNGGPLSVDAAKSISPSLYGGTWAVPAVVTPGPFAGMDLGRVSAAMADSWAAFDAMISPGIPSVAGSPLGFSSLFNTMTGLLEDDPATAVESEANALCHLPGSVPQLTNPNPERPLLRIQSEGIWRKIGPDLDPTDRFYLPPERMASCYTIPHWRMPSMQVLRRIARQTVSGLLTHLPLVHLPTFQMSQVPVGLAFAICTVGNPKKTQGRDPLFGAFTQGDVRTPEDEAHAGWFMGNGVLRPDPPCAAICGIDDGPDSQEELEFDERRKMILVEKTGMVTQTLARSKGKHLSQFNVGMLQALLLYAAPLLLAPQISQRQEGYVRLGVVINSAKHVDVFNAKEAHYRVCSGLRTGDDYFSISEPTLETAWRDWIRQETIRRLAWMLYMFDTLCSLESGIPTSISPPEVAAMPLPASDSVWKAQSAAEWNQALMAYQPATLEDCMVGLFKVKSWTVYGGPAPEAVTDSPDKTCILDRTDFGMFARYMMILTLLRGILDIGHGKRATGDWRAVTGLWTDSPEDKPALEGLGDPHATLTLSEVVDLYGVALHRWRRGWDFDPLCDAPAVEALKYQSYVKKEMEDKLSPEQSTPELTPGAKAPDGGKTDSSGLTPGMVATPDFTCDTILEVMNKPKKGILFYEEALPLYWLSQALHSILSADKGVLATRRREDGTVPYGFEARASAWINRFAGIDVAKMLQSARVFTRLGEGITTNPAS